MTKKLYDGIKEGLLELKDFMDGKDTGATVYTPIDIKSLRAKYKLSQSKFADEFGLNANTLKNWEHGTRTLDTSTITLFSIIDKYPDIVKNVVKNNKKSLHN
jgi:putative transcriptional regulator